MTYPAWIRELPKLGKPLPVLSFPSVSLTGAGVYDLTHDPAVQTAGILRVAAEVDAAAAVTMMDLSVEAEAFGCPVTTERDQIPTVCGAVISSPEDGEHLCPPPVGAGRTGIYLQAAQAAKRGISDRPVLAGIIGPFSLAGRLMDVSEALMNCIAEPEMVHAVLRVTTDYLADYAAAYKEAGMDGVIMAEPLAGLLSPALEREFSAPYVAEIVRRVQDDRFGVVYHNCGPNTVYMAPELAGIGAAAYHFGDAVSLPEMLEKMPADTVVMGNISPTREFLSGTPESMRRAVAELRTACAGHPNFVLSSGCDVPPGTPWENIRAFFE